MEEGSETKSSKPPPPPRRNSLSQRSPELAGLAHALAARSDESNQVRRPQLPADVITAPRMDLMSAIKAGAGGLKAVVIEPKAPPPPDTSNLLGMLAMAMTDRRVAFVQEDGSDSDASGFSDDD